MEEVNKFEQKFEDLIGAIVTTAETKEEMLAGLLSMFEQTFIEAKNNSDLVSFKQYVEENF